MRTRLARFKQCQGEQRRWGEGQRWQQTVRAVRLVAGQSGGTARVGDAAAEQLNNICHMSCAIHLGFELRHIRLLVRLGAEQLTLLLNIHLDIIQRILDLVTAHDLTQILCFRHDLIGPTERERVPLIRQLRLGGRELVHLHMQASGLGR